MGTDNEFKHKKDREGESDTEEQEIKAVSKMVRENKRLKEEVHELEDEISDIYDRKTK